MNKVNLIKDLIIRDLVCLDTSKIISLIKRVYGNEYPDKEFYDSNIIRSIFMRSTMKKTEKMYWKGAFFKRNLVGQMLLILENKVGFLKSTMVARDYMTKGIISKVCVEMENILQEMNDSDMKCLYAFVSKRNIPILHVLKRNKFHYLGTVPAFSKNEILLIYGRVLYDFKWRMINPLIKLSPEIYKITRDGRFKRIVSGLVSPLHRSKGVIIDKFTFKWSADSFPKKFEIISEEGQTLALFDENIYQKSWYNFRIVDDLNIDTIRKIVKETIKRFQTNDNLSSLSFVVYVNNKMFQKLLLDMGAQFYAFLPFYINKKDMILMGFSKIEEEVRKIAG